MKEKTLNISEIKYLLKKRYKSIIISVILFTGLASWYAFTKMRPVYNANIKIFACKSEDIKGDYSQGELSAYAGLVDTYIQLIKTDNFMNKVIVKAGLNMSPEQLIAGVGFSKLGDAPILNISYTSNNPEISKKVVEIIADEFAVGVREIIVNTHTKVIDNVKVRTQMPNRKKVIILGFLSGLIIGVGIIFIQDYLDDTIKGKKELEELLPIPVLVELPLEKDYKK